MAAPLSLYIVLLPSDGLANLLQVLTDVESTSKQRPLQLQLTALPKEDLAA